MDRVDPRGKAKAREAEADLVNQAMKAEVDIVENPWKDDPRKRGKPDDRADAPDVGAAGQRAGDEGEAGRAPEPATQRPGLGEDDFAGEGSVEGYVGFFWMRLRPV